MDLKIESTPKSTLLRKTENQDLPLTLKACLPKAVQAESLIFSYFTSFEMALNSSVPAI